MIKDSKDAKKELARFILDNLKQKLISSDIAASLLKEMQKETTIVQPQSEMAVIGMACRFPEANNPDELWMNLVKGRNSIGEFPYSRKKDIENIGGDISSLMKAGYLDSVDQFDPEYFNLPPRTAEQMDPYHRLLLQIFIETIEDAGYHRGHFHGKDIGVFVGNDHSHRLETSYLSFLEERDFLTLTGSWTGILASRLSYLLNLTGPSMVIDTACSSSLVAIDSAIKAIQQGDCESALIGGANLLLYPGKMDGEIQAEDYKVHAFDNQASGTVWGEGVAAILIKPLSQALKDNDHVYGVIKGVAVNNDGTSNGLTSPNAKAQERVILKAWERAKVNPESITYIETHGTATKIGDPIEIKGITSAFRKHSTRKQFCSIGSIKSNIGHTVGTAGLASLIKVLLSMKKRILPPTINFSQPNPFIDFCNSPVYVQDRLSVWETEGPRRAGISSFSFSGTNSHMVVEEAPLDNRAKSVGGWYLLPISGRTPKLLHEMAKRYFQYLSKNRDLRVEDICYTACTGREHYPIRATILCSDINSLLDGLEVLTKSLEEGQLLEVDLFDKRPFALYCSQTLFNSEKDYLENKLSIGETITISALHPLCQNYIYGKEVNFNELFNEVDVRRCSIPPQVFKNDRYWGDKQIIQNTNSGEVENKVLDSDAIWSKYLEHKKQLNEEVQLNKPAEFIAWVWSQVLGYKSIRPSNDFYQLGGDSVTGLQIIQMLNIAYNTDMPLSVLMSNPVLEDFVIRVEMEFITPQLYKQQSEDENRILSKKEEKILKLSPAQNRMYLTTGLRPDSVAYNVTAVMELEQNEMSVNKLETILGTLINRHDALRTSFHLRDGEPIQIIHQKINFSVEKYLLESRKGLTKVEQIQSEVKKFIRPFELTEAPLFRVGYFQFKGDLNVVYVVFDFHHIITDGTSMGILLSDFVSLAEGKILSPSMTNYAEAVQWMIDRKQSPSLEKQRKWWINQFSDEIPILNIPTDKTRPSVRDYEGSKIHYTIPSPLLKEMKDLAKSSGCTLFMVLLAAFHSLLTKLGADRDIVIGTPVAGRPKMEFYHIVGMFINTLPIRTISNPDERFTDFLLKVKNNVLESFDNQEYPYESLIEDVLPERDPGRNPLFDVYFALQNIDTGAPYQGNIIEVDSGSAKVDLSVEARETADGLLLEWEYAESLFYRSSIEKMAERFEIILQSIVDSPQQLLSNLSIMHEKEVKLLLEDWDGKSQPIPIEEGVIPLFEQQVRQSMNSIALQMNGQQLRYGELNGYSNRIANYIIERGIKPGSPVGLLFERSFEMIASIIGVLKAGCYYIPLDIQNPPDRMQAILNDSNLTLLLTHRNLALAAIPNHSNLAIINVLEIPTQISDENPMIKVSGEDPAYVIYTSGSTGIPKGTMIRHKSITRTVKEAKYITIYENDAILALSNYSFDASIFEYFGSLLNGSKLVLINENDVKDLNRLANCFLENDITLSFITVALFNALVESRLECLKNTRKIIFGGDAASPYHVRKAYDYLGPGRLINGYGPTETTVFAAYYPVNQRPEEDTIPIGQPIGNTKLYVLDEHRNLVPPGVPGELYIGGLGVAIGYVNRPDLTKKSFVTDPFNPSEKLYKTGDLVVLQDGNLKYLGRMDQQVKLRGYRIELPEIELTALESNMVSEAYVGLYGDSSHGKSLCMWVVPKQIEVGVNTEQLRVVLEKRLPNYMIPAFIIVMDAFPLNKNGKLDKAKLPSPTQIITNVQEPPKNDMESLLLKIWKEVLGIQHIGVNDNFFRLGGDSIKSILVASKLYEAGYRVDASKIFEYQTISTIAPQVEEANRIIAEQGEVLGDVIPNAIQHWFLHKDSEVHHFHQGLYIRSKQRFPWGVIKNAIERLCSHHDMLRLIATPNKGIRIRAANEDKLYYLREFSTKGNLQYNIELLELIQQINIYDGPIIAVGIEHAEEGDNLYIAVHHLAVDVVSWGVLLGDLFHLLDNPNYTLPDKTTSFPEWTNKLQEWAKAGGVRDEIPYWRKLAEKVKHHESPFPLVNVPYKDVGHHEQVIGGKESNKLCGDANKAFHTETVHLVLAILVKAIGNWLNRTDLLFNLEGHGREGFHPELDVNRTIGWFTSNYPVLLTNLDENGNSIKAIKETVNTVPRRGFGYGVLKSMTPDLPITDQQLFEEITPYINFNYLGKQGQIAENGMEIQTLPTVITIGPNYHTSWPLDITASEVDSGVLLQIDYAKELFKKDQISELQLLIDRSATDITNYCLERLYGEKTASDFKNTSLGQEELEDILLDLGIQD